MKVLMVLMAMVFLSVQAPAQETWEERGCRGKAVSIVVLQKVSRHLYVVEHPSRYTRFAMLKTHYTEFQSEGLAFACVVNAFPKEVMTVHTEAGFDEKRPLLEEHPEFRGWKRSAPAPRPARRDTTPP